MAQPRDIIIAGVFDGGLYVFNLPTFNRLGSAAACLPIVWVCRDDVNILVLVQMLLCLWIWNIQKQIKLRSTQVQVMRGELQDIFGRCLHCGHDGPFVRFQRHC